MNEPTQITFTPDQLTDQESVFNHLPSQLRVEIIKAYQEHDQPDEIIFEVVEKKNQHGFPYYEVTLKNMQGGYEWKVRRILAIVSREL